MRVLFVFAFLVVSRAATWSAGGSNDPSTFSSSYGYSFKALAAKASAKTSDPWSDTYWPSYQSGIAHRWYAQTPNDFRYKTLSLAQLKNASLSTLQQLSPAEKLDIIGSRFDYPTVKSEWQRTSPNDASWEGLCHGWAPASMFFKQPNPVTITSPDGIKVPFGSSDVKALLIYFTGTYDEAFSTSSYLGERCNYDLTQNPNLATRPSCADMNAGAFFVQLTNQIAALQQGFVVDRDRSIQVWNQPVYSYAISGVQSNGTAVNFTLTYTYGKETVPSWKAHPVYPVSEQLQISLLLDSRGNVIGGDYGGFDRPDFSWAMQIADFSGYFTILKSIYEASIGGSHSASFAERPAALQRAGHKQLLELSGTVRVRSYSRPQPRQSWSIAPQTPAGRVHLSFRHVDIERVYDMIRVYELDARTGELGALIRVIHGKADSVEISVSGAVYISFATGFNSRGGDGFTLSYSVDQ